jgi:hypothetical protein
MAVKRVTSTGALTANRVYQDEYWRCDTCGELSREETQAALRRERSLLHELEAIEEAGEQHTGIRDSVP